MYRWCNCFTDKEKKYTLQFMFYYVNYTYILWQVFSFYIFLGNLSKTYIVYKPTILPGVPDCSRLASRMFLLHVLRAPPLPRCPWLRAPRLPLSPTRGRSEVLKWEGSGAKSRKSDEVVQVGCWISCLK